MLQSPITSLTFHPTHPLLLTTSPSPPLLSTHHLTTTAQPANPAVHTLALPHHPLAAVGLAPSGATALLAPRARPYFFAWSLATGTLTRAALPTRAAEHASYERLALSPCGRYVAVACAPRKGGGDAGKGAANVLDAKTMMWLCQARVEGRHGLAAFAWWRDGNGLVLLGSGGDVVEYNVRKKRAVTRWMDHGGVGVSCLALGGKVKGGKARVCGPDRWAAIGSKSGIVNLYDRATWSGGEADGLATEMPERPVPVRVLENLTTTITQLLFSPPPPPPKDSGSTSEASDEKDSDAQMLVMASRAKRDAVRLVHLPSGTVYPRWPTSATPLGRVTAVAASRGGRLLAVGNEQGRVRMWEIRG